MNTPVKIFISYTQDDVSYKRALQAHLSGLKRKGIIKDWTDEEILPGKIWEDEKKIALHQADIILFLVSASFIASEFQHDKEVTAAMERYKKGKALIVPILIRPCDIDSLEIGKFKILPKDKLPISKWTDQDEAYLNIVLELKRIIGKIEVENNDLVIIDEEQVKNVTDNKLYDTISRIEMEQYQSLIANDEVKEVIDQLLKKTFKAETKHILITLSSRLKAIKKQEMLGTVTQDSANVENNRIKKSTLAILETIVT